jgi:hypothetical protein
MAAAATAAASVTPTHLHRPSEHFLSFSLSPLIFFLSLAMLRSLRRYIFCLRGAALLHLPPNPPHALRSTHGSFFLQRYHFDFLLRSFIKGKWNCLRPFRISKAFSNLLFQVHFFASNSQLECALNFFLPGDARKFLLLSAIYISFQQGTRDVLQFRSLLSDLLLLLKTKSHINFFINVQRKFTCLLAFILLLSIAFSYRKSASAIMRLRSHAM